MNFLDRRRQESPVNADVRAGEKLLVAIATMHQETYLRFA